MTAPTARRSSKETTAFIFRADRDGLRIIDRITTLTARRARTSTSTTTRRACSACASRARSRSRATKPESSPTPPARSTKVAALDNTGVNGVYPSSEGKKGEAVWGTRGKWTTLDGQVGGRAGDDRDPRSPAATPAIPTYWHARGYGLFAANPLGQEAFSDGKEKLGFSIRRGASQLFRYRVLIADRAITPEQMGPLYDAWIEEATQ